MQIQNGQDIMGRPWTMRFPALLLVTTLVACGGEARLDPDTFTVVDSGGVQVVESLSPAWGDETRWIDSEPLLRIGQEDEGPYQFGFLAQGILLKDGSIVIPEFGAQEIRVFDSTGRHEYSFGRRGEGPGEFQNLSGVFEYSGDSLAAYDGGLRRITVFSESSGSHRTILNEVEGNYWVFGLLRNGPFMLYDLGRGFRPDLHAWPPVDLHRHRRFGPLRRFAEGHRSAPLPRAVHRTQR